MASAPLILPRQAPLPPPLPAGMDVDLPHDNPFAQSMEGNALKIETGDGGVIIDFNPGSGGKPRENEKFNDNLAMDMNDAELNRICQLLLEGIANDEQSRADQINSLAEGTKLLGLVLESANTSSGSTTAPLEGMSTVMHPMLLDACLMFNAQARGELLPASGPAKVRDDMPARPSMMGHNGGPPLDGASPFAPPAAAPMPPAVPQQPTPPGGTPPPPINAAPPQSPVPAEPQRDRLAAALETDFNHYLTSTAKEYYPDTDQMLFKVGFGGLGIKKVYNCPIRRRPVSESVAIEDFIVSNALSSLDNATRITQKSRMRPSILRRMQILGVYRDYKLQQPQQSDQPNAMEQQQATITGVKVQPQDPKDADYTVFECYCELVLDRFAPAKFKDKEMPLPFRVTIDKDAEKILEIRRNWKEADEQCMPRKFFVEFPFVRTFGFYGTGLLHILGNTTKTLTMAWREFIDSGMFANFPGFVYAKGAGRQLSNQFRVPPGGGVGLDVGLADIRNAVMPLPYKDLGPAFTAFIQHVEELGSRLGGTAQIAIGEGRQDAPVGTTLALIEQATKPTGAVQKRLHAAQGEELALLKERFKDDPEAFWRFNPRPAQPWQREEFIKALDDWDIVPVSDPNNPTSLHRAAKGEWLKQTAIAAPGLLDPKKVFIRAAELEGIDGAEDLISTAPPQGMPIDPNKQAALQLQAGKHMADQQGAQSKAQLDIEKFKLEMQDRQAERESRLQVAKTEQDTERLRLASTLAIHSSEAEAARAALTMQIGSAHAKHGRELASDHVMSELGQQHEHVMADRDHGRTMEQMAQQAEHDRRLAAAKPKPNGTSK